ncbi:ribosomal RNA processing protein 36 homolog, partial [Spea bombifrons]|uniref:ribosomal RNA processing protein 36 homolog n=1 Tax=Spea bombifrons TaxID=233779 RepID=UPI002348EEB2
MSGTSAVIVNSQEISQAVSRLLAAMKYIFDVALCVAQAFLNYFTLFYVLHWRSIPGTAGGSSPGHSKGLSRPERMRRQPIGPPRYRETVREPSPELHEESSSEDTDGEDVESGEEGEETQHGEELSTMSFEDLLQLQNKVGTKELYRQMKGASGGRREDPEKARPGKDQPLEMSSKRPVAFLRKVTGAKKEMRRDPRFDDLSGEFKPEVFEKTYTFLEDVKKREKEIVNKKLRKVSNPELKDKLEQLLRRMDQQEKASQEKQKMRERQLEFKKQQREQAAHGKKPFYLKRGDLQKMELAEKFNELKKQGKLENFLSKKRKRNSNKD